MRFPAVLLFAVFAACAVLSLASGCSNQGEGDFCDINAANTDCMDGLQCGPAPGLPEVASGDRNRCCPIPPAMATTPTCTRSSGGFDGSTEVPDAFVDGTVIPESSSGSDAPPSAEASSDAASDAASDGPSDATMNGISETGAADGALESGAGEGGSSDGSRE